MDFARCFRAALSNNFSNDLVGAKIVKKSIAPDKDDISGLQGAPLMMEHHAISRTEKAFHGLMINLPMLEEVFKDQTSIGSFTKDFSVLFSLEFVGGRPRGMMDDLAGSILGRDPQHDGLR